MQVDIGKIEKQLKTLKEMVARYDNIADFMDHAPTKMKQQALRIMDEIAKELRKYDKIRELVEEMTRFVEEPKWNEKKEEKPAYLI
jgi:uncharacterized protein YdcH (DUF465 family)